MKPADNKPDRETLRHLYEDERLTQREIGQMYGVRHITIRRWMIAYDIPRRTANRGLANRGITAPTPDELYDMVHVQHLSYAEIAGRYGVDHSAIAHWLKKHGIRTPSLWETRRKGKQPKTPSIDELRHRRSLGESISAIAKSCEVSRGTIAKLCRQNGIPVDRDGWDGGKRYPCLDGHEARSVYEQTVDNWLHEHSLTHEVEPRYPFDGRFRADFLVRDTYIEVWGVSANAAYQERKQKKIELCQAASLPLIQLGYWHFQKRQTWRRHLQPLLAQGSDAYLF